MSGRHASPTRPTAVEGGRLEGLDLARGLAVLSMLVAHLSPVGGLLDVTEYLTAPLFAVVIAISMALRLDTGVPAWRVIGDNVLRGLLLLLVGVVLQLLYAQIDVVLPYLGVLVVVLAPLVVLLRTLPLLTLGLAVGAAVLGPIVTDLGRSAVDAGTVTGPLRDLLLWTATGSNYRLVSFLPMALGALAFALLLPRLDRPVPAAATSTVLLATSLLVHLLGRETEAGAAAYSGSTAEVVAATFLALGVVSAAFAVVHAVGDHVPRLAPVLAPVLATGRLAFTAYVLQILVLAAISVARDGASDNSFLVLLVTAVVVVGGCWALDRFVGTGPFEVASRFARLPERPSPDAQGRHATRR